MRACVSARIYTRAGKLHRARARWGERGWHHEGEEDGGEGSTLGRFRGTGCGRRAIVGVAPRLPWRLSARRPINSIPMATTDNIGHTPCRTTTRLSVYTSFRRCPKEKADEEARKTRPRLPTAGSSIGKIPSKALLPLFSLSTSSTFKISKVDARGLFAFLHTLLHTLRLFFSLPPPLAFLFASIPLLLSARSRLHRIRPRFFILHQLSLPSVPPSASLSCRSLPIIPPPLHFFSLLLFGEKALRSSLNEL